jgi:hypothetical protein
MQAVCDSKMKFLDVSILQPASASDYLCFLTSDLSRNMNEGILDNNLCLFGDNAYVNQTYMATPYSNVGLGSKDNYNFYHSQLRINIECAFGSLVNRWRVLRSPLSASISIERTVALVMSLCRLHNWCIDYNSSTVPDQLIIDPRSIIDIDPINLTRPEALLNGGAHFDDVVELRRQQLMQNNRNNTTILPREQIHNSLLENGYERPPL